MYLDVRNLREEPLSFRMEVPVGKIAWQHQESVQVGKVHLEGQVVPAKDGLLLRGRLRAITLIPCARCLEAFELPLDSNIMRVFVRGPVSGSSGGSEERKMQVEEIPLTSYDGRRIDLRSLAVEQIQLDLPLKPICREDCRGLCDQCGGNRNQVSCDCSHAPVDPRWAALETFRKKS